MVKVLIDNGHGQGSPKGSPDGKHKEWKWARAMAKRLAIRLNHYGIPSHILVPEDADISLKDRAARANAIAVFSSLSTVTQVELMGNGTMLMGGLYLYRSMLLAIQRLLLL